MVVAPKKEINIITCMVIFSLLSSAGAGGGPVMRFVMTTTRVCVSASSRSSSCFNDSSAVSLFSLKIPLSSPGKYFGWKHYNLWIQ